jgi:imidazolonepropionase-like amidohydrolase
LIRQIGLALLAAALASVLVNGAIADDALIEHARIYSMVAGESVLEDGQILLRGETIAAIGTNLTAPPGARVVDAQGRVVTPGLVAAASQLGLTEISGNDHSTDHTTTSPGPGAGFDVSLAINANSELLRLALADGLIHAVSLPGGSSDPLFNGQGALLKLLDGPNILQQAGLLQLARIGGASAAAGGGSRAAQWQLLQLALQAARQVEVLPGKQPAGSLEELNRAALQGLLDGKQPLLLDVRRESDIRQAIVLQQQFGLRLVILGGSEAWRVAPELAAARVPVILDAGSYLPMSTDEWGVRADAARILHEAGVLLAFYPSFSLYYSLNAGTGAREAAGFAVANGLDWEAGLRGLTINPAQIFGFEHQAGTLATGRPADLVIWDGDPLEPASAPVMVLVDGKEASRVTRQTLLRDRYHPHAGRRSAPQVLPPAYH